jgi:hypothetical protein
MPAFLKKEIAGIPVGIWLVVIAGGVVAGIYLRQRNQTDAAGEGEETTEGYETVPYGELPADPYQLPGGGYYGAPTVSGGGAIRLLGPKRPIRIIVRGPKHKPKDKDGGKKKGGKRPPPYSQPPPKNY